MKSKIKLLYKDKVEPTTLKEINMCDIHSIESFKQDINDKLDDIFNKDTDIIGLFVSVEGK